MKIKIYSCRIYSAHTRAYFPRTYSGNERVLYESPTPLARGVWHRIVFKYVEGLGIDNTPAPGQSVPGIMGPNPDATNRFALGSGEGAVTFWLDGVKLVDVSGIAGGYTDSEVSQSIYAKLGIYRSIEHTVGDTFVVIYQNVTVGSADLSARVGAQLQLY